MALKDDLSREVIDMNVRYMAMLSSTDSGNDRDSREYNRRKREEYKTFLASSSRNLVNQWGAGAFAPADLATLENWMTWG